MPETDRPPTRLMLVLPEIAADTALGGALSAALGAGDIAAVVLPCPAGADERGLLRALKPLIAAIQAAGAAALIEGAPDLAGKSGADGVQASGVAASREAVARFAPGKIVGAAGMRLRDDAMTAAESGADYLMFGEPQRGAAPPPAATLDLVGWWAELFEIPCAGYAADADSVGPLAEAGADFVALGPWALENPAASVAAAMAAIAADAAAP